LRRPSPSDLHYCVPPIPSPYPTLPPLSRCGGLFRCSGEREGWRRQNAGGLYLLPPLPPLAAATGALPVNGVRGRGLLQHRGSYCQAVRYRFYSAAAIFFVYCACLQPLCGLVPTVMRLVLPFQDILLHVGYWWVNARRPYDLYDLRTRFCLVVFGADGIMNDVGYSMRGRITIQTVLLGWQVCRFA